MTDGAGTSAGSSNDVFPGPLNRSPIRRRPTKYHYRPELTEKVHLKRHRSNVKRVAKLKKKDRPMSWKLAIRCFNAGMMYGYRSQANIDQYDAARALDRKIWKDIESQIKHEVFNMPREVDVFDTGLYRVRQPLEKNMRHLMVNKYPYHYAAGITNWVLWFEKEDATREEMIAWVEGYPELDGFDLIVYENPTRSKSVRGIRHLQILARKTKEGGTRQIYFHSNNE